MYPARPFWGLFPLQNCKKESLTLCDYTCFWHLKTQKHSRSPLLILYICCEFFGSLYKSVKVKFPFYCFRSLSLKQRHIEWIIIFILSQILTSRFSLYNQLNLNFPSTGRSTTRLCYVWTLSCNNYEWKHEYTLVRRSLLSYYRNF